MKIATVTSDKALLITDEHPVLSVLTNGVQSATEIKSRLSKGLINMDYHEAKTIDEDCYIAYKIPSYSQDIASINDADMIMFGQMCMYMDLESVRSNHYILEIPKDDSIIKTMKNYLSNNMINYIFEDNETSFILKWKKDVNFKFNMSDFVYHNKKTISSRILNLPAEKTKLICSNIDISKCSIDLEECVRFLCIKNGLQNNDVFEHNGYIYERVSNVTKTSYSGVLYDLQMEKEHNYMIHNGIIHNGGGKRNGSFAMYLEPWHGDIENFLELRKNHGDEEARARDLFYALWIPDLFMEKVEKNEDWYLMCPNISKGLHDVYGDEFKTLYEKYVSEGKFIKKMKARDLWFQLLDSQMETGTPYMLYKDACNKKSNQKNLGVIKSSNLCTEIIEHSNADESAVCNLASISLSSMVNQETKEFDYHKLCEITKIVTRNLNNVIDVNYYPTDKTYRSNMRHRPIGIGVQGLADALALMDIPFHSEKALEVNKLIFETIYYGAMYQSNVLAMERQDKMKKLREMLDNDANSYFHVLQNTQTK